MKTIQSIICLLLVCYYSECIYSQDVKKPDSLKLWDFKIPQGLNSGYTAISVNKNDRSRDIIPAKDAERFKMRFTIKNDAAYFTLKAEKLKYAKHFEDQYYNDRIIYWPDLKKGEIVFFELVPDISLSNKLTLFTYFPQMTSFKFMNCPENNHFKYKLFEIPTKQNNNSGPLMLIYIDDKDNNIEKLVNKYCNNNLITNSPNKYEKLLKEIELCMLIHYEMDNKPSKTD